MHAGFRPSHRINLYDFSIKLKKKDRLLILAVHPDDETLATAGLIQHAIAANAELRIIIVTDGDNNPWPQRWLERRWHIRSADRVRWGKRRRKEAKAALTALGYPVDSTVFLGWPDQGITNLLTSGNQQVIEQLLAEIIQHQPSLLIVPLRCDRHPDHNALAVLIDFALARLPSAQIHPRMLAYLTHGPQVLRSSYSINLSTQELNCKRQAILCHQTQTALGRKRFLRYANPQELFFPLQSEVEPSLCPALKVCVVAENLYVRIQMSAILHLLGKPVLYLLAETEESSLRLKMALDSNGSVDIIDSSNGVRISQCMLKIGKGMVEVAIPLRTVKNADTVYLKLERRWCFYDLNGWSHVSLKPAVRPAINLLGIIPCYDVEDFCEQVILQTMNHVDHLIVINDGSSDGTAAILDKLSAITPERVTVINFSHNQGKGAGLIAGFSMALDRFNFQIVVTLDADGQHSPDEIPKLIQTVAAGAEMAIGERQLQQMPLRSRVGNLLASCALRWLYPRSPTDTQSGFRAFNPVLIKEIVGRVAGSRYETEIQILLLALTQQRRIARVPVSTIYIDDNRSSKFRPVTDSLRIFRAVVNWYCSYWSWFRR